MEKSIKGYHIFYLNEDAIYSFIEYSIPLSGSNKCNGGLF